MNNYLSHCLWVRNQTHLYHLQTTSYAEHKALNEFYGWLLDLVDSLVETYQGVHGRITLIDAVTSPANYTDHSAVVACVQEFVTQTRSMKTTISESDSDIQNIIDELMALGNQTLYMLSLR